MTALNAAALAAIRDAGFTRAEWLRMHGYDGKWTGDSCGCKDDRCANGFHHMGANDCGFGFCSPWSMSGQFHWELSGVRSLWPVPCKGALGLWRLPEDAEKAVRAQLEGN
jgi:hypothetical protein